MPLEDARDALGTIQGELDRRRLMIRAFAVMCIALLGLTGFLAYKLRAVDVGVRRTDCARAIADETSRLDRAADRAFAQIVVFAFRLPQGSPVTPPLSRLVDEYEVANQELEARPPNQELVEQTCPG